MDRAELRLALRALDDGAKIVHRSSSDLGRDVVLREESSILRVVPADDTRHVFCCPCSFTRFDLDDFDDLSTTHVRISIVRQGPSPHRTHMEHQEPFLLPMEVLAHLDGVGLACGRKQRSMRKAATVREMSPEHDVAVPLLDFTRRFVHHFGISFFRVKSS